MIIEHAGYLPGVDADSVDRQAKLYGREGAKISVLLPVLHERQVAQLVGHVRDQARLKLKSRPLGQIIDAIDLTISRLLDREDP